MKFPLFLLAPLFPSEGNALGRKRQKRAAENKAPRRSLSLSLSPFRLFCAAFLRLRSLMSSLLSLLVVFRARPKKKRAEKRRGVSGREKGTVRAWRPTTTTTTTTTTTHGGIEVEEGGQRTHT